MVDREDPSPNSDPVEAPMPYAVPLFERSRAKLSSPEAPETAIRVMSVVRPYGMFKVLGVVEEMPRAPSPQEDRVPWSDMAKEEDPPPAIATMDSFRIVRMT